MDGARLRDDRLALLLIAIGLVVRLAFFADMTAKGVDLRGRINIDTYYYHRQAVRITKDVLFRERFEFTGVYPDEPGHPRFCCPIRVFGAERYDAAFAPATYFEFPGYAYFVAAFYYCCGEDTNLVYLAQLLLDLGACAVAYGIARRIADRSVARLALALLVLDGPLVFHAGFLLRDSLITSLVVFLVGLALRAGDSPRARWGALLGALFGATWIVKGSIVLLLPYFLYALIVRRGGALDRGKTAARLAAFALGALTAVGPFVARNVYLGCAPFKMSTSEAALVLLNNGPNAAVRGLSFDLPTASRAAVRMRSISTLEALRVAVTEHPSLLGAPAQSATRVLNLYRADDPWDNVRYSWLARCLPSLALAPVRFKLFAAFVPLGLLLALRDPRRWLPVLAPIGFVALMAVLSTCVTRYRMNADFAHAILAAEAAVWMLKGARAKDRASLLGAASVLVCALLLHDPEAPPARERIAGHVAATFSPRTASALLETLERA